MGCSRVYDIIGAKPRRKGKIEPKGSFYFAADFQKQFGHWLADRNLEGCLSLTTVGDREPLDEVGDGFATYKCTGSSAGAVGGEKVAIAYHGTWWHGLWNILASGTLLESNDLAKGHEYSFATGVYCSPLMATVGLAMWGA